MNSKVKGYLLGAIAAASYGMNPLFAVPLYGDGMDPDSVLLFRYLLAIPILGVMIKSRGHDFRIPLNMVIPVAIMGLLIAISSYTLFESYNYIDVGIASTLLFIYPIMVTLIMRAVFKEKITAQMTVCMLFALIGVALLYNTGEGMTLNTKGTLLAFASGLSYACYIVGVNQSGLKEIPTLKLTFYAIGFGIFLFLARVMMNGGLNMPKAEHWYLWGDVLGLAVFPTAISFLCTTAAIHCIGSSPTAILGALEPVTAVIVGVCLFGEQLTPRIAAGLLLIIISVTLVIAGGNLKTHLTHFRKLFPRRTKY